MYCGINRDHFCGMYKSILPDIYRDNKKYRFATIVTTFRLFNSYMICRDCTPYISYSDDLFSCLIIASSLRDFELMYKVDDETECILDIINTLDNHILDYSVLDHVRKICDENGVKSTNYEEIAVLVMHEPYLYTIDPYFVAVNIVNYTSMLFDTSMYVDNNSTDIVSILHTIVISNDMPDNIKVAISRKNIISEDIPIIEYVADRNNIISIPSIPDYVKNKLLGEGMSYKVYKCKDTIAVKVAKKMESDIITDIVVMKCVDHPNLNKPLQCYINQNKIHILMDLAKTSLDSVIFDTLYEKRTRRSWMSQLISGVKYLHNKGIIHGDIKSENILLYDDNTIKLTDFGISKVGLTSELDKRKKCSYICSHRPPEILHNIHILHNDTCKYSTEVDIWSLGITLAEIEIQNYVFSVPTYKILFEKQYIFLLKCMERTLGRYKIYPVLSEDLLPTNDNILSCIKDIKLRKTILSMLNYTPDERPLISEICI